MANTNVPIDTDLLNFYDKQQVVPLKKKVENLTAQSVGAIPSEEKGANNGIPTLDANGKIPTTQMPEELYTIGISNVDTGSWTDVQNTVDGVTYTNKVHITNTKKQIRLTDNTTAQNTDVEVLSNAQLNLPLATNGLYGIASFDSRTLTVDKGVVKINPDIISRITNLEQALQSVPDGDEVEY
jgi:hypothetical protein